METISIILGLIAVGSIVLTVFLVKRIFFLKKTFRENIQNEQDRFFAEMNDAKNRAEERLKDIQHQASLEIEKERQKAEQEIKNIRSEIDAKINKMRSDTESQIKEIQEEANKAIQFEKDKAQKTVCDMQEFIESRRKILSTTNEKDLLVDIVLALDGYGNRFERIEEKLIADKFTQKIEFMATSMENTLSESTDKMKANINKVSSHLEEKADRIIASLEEKLEKTEKNIDKTLSSSDVVFSINSMNSTIEKIQNTFQQYISDDADSGDAMSYKINEILEEYDDLKKTVDEIKEHLGEYGYESIDSKLDYVKENFHSIDEIKDLLNDLKNCLGDSEYDSISDKLDRLQYDIQALNN